LMGAAFSAFALAAGFARGVLTGAGFMATGLGDLLSFTVTFDVAREGAGFAGGRAAFFGAGALWAAFFGVALPGRLAALLGFFEGI